MPAHHYSSLDLGLNSSGQASDRPQGRKPRGQWFDVRGTAMLWGFGFAVTVWRTTRQLLPKPTSSSVRPYIYFSSTLVGDFEPHTAVFGSIVTSAGTGEPLPNGSDSPEGFFVVVL
jgi:hypothetical protein